MTVTAGHRCADPLRHRASSTRTSPTTVATSTCASRSTVASPRPTRPPTDDEALDALVRSTLDAAALQPVDPGWPGLAAAGRGAARRPLGRRHRRRRPRTSAPSASARFVDAAGGLETAGFCSTEGIQAAFANSRRPTAHRAARPRRSVDGIARTGDRRRLRASRIGAARATSTGRPPAPRPTQRARDAGDATDLEPGRYEVVLAPSCVVNVLSFLPSTASTAARSRRADRSSRLGEAQFDRVDLARRRRHRTRRRSASASTPRERRSRRVDLVRDGVSAAILHDRRTAKALGGRVSTGHAVAGARPVRRAAAPTSSSSAGDRDADELLAGVERGLLVTDFWYTRVLDPRTHVVTGLTRNGVWLIEDGEIVRPVTNLRFTQSFVEALAPGAVRASASDADAGRWRDLRTSAPTSCRRCTWLSGTSPAAPRDAGAELPSCCRACAAARPTRTAWQASASHDGISRRPSACSGTPRSTGATERSTITTAASGSTPAARTAPTVSTREAPVVRMSSTSTTRSSAATGQPRRSALPPPGIGLREGGAHAVPELASRLERQEHAAGGRPDDQGGPIRRERLGEAAAQLDAEGAGAAGRGTSRGSGRHGARTSGGSGHRAGLRSARTAPRRWPRRASIGHS